MAERYLILSCMKNEGPFLLEWVAYHLSIGFDHMLVFTNDCDDGTDKMLTRLGEHGYVTHRRNPYREGVRPSAQVRAYRRARRDPVYQMANWVAVIDADEFLNIHVGDRSIQALTSAVPRARCISLTWRLFGSSGQTSFTKGFLTEKLRRAAAHHCPSPIQAWGMKSIFRREAVDLIGCHRPKALTGAWEDLGWVNGAGTPMPSSYFEGSWRMNRDTVAYDLGQINHYALRSRESFMIKSIRGRALGSDARGPSYWAAMDRNEELDETIQPLLPKARVIFRELLEDPKLARLHRRAVKWHRERISEALDRPEGQLLMQAISPQSALFASTRKRVYA